MNPNPKPDNLVVLEPTGYAPTNAEVARNLRDWADAIEQDEDCYGTVIIVMEVDGRVRRAVIGGPGDRARTTGILFHAATAAVGDCRGWDPEVPNHDDRC